MLTFWVVVTVVMSHLCSLLEVTLFSVRTSALLERRAAGSLGAARLLEIKQTRVDDAISTILILNTVSITVGATLGGAYATELFGEAWVGLFSAVLTVLLLVLAEIIPKTIAARHAGQFSAFTGYTLSHLMRVMTPLLVITRALVRLLARRQRERFTRKEFSFLVGAAPQDGAISRAEAKLIGNLIYSQEILLEDVMTPHAVVFMLDEGCTVSDLIEAAGADAFSRIPLFAGDRRHVRGYVSHREVLKAYAKGCEGASPLVSFLHPIPTFPESEPVAKAFEKILAQHEAIGLVTNKYGDAVGLATLEDMLEAILGMEITDEPEAVADLRPAVAESRKHRAERLQRQRAEQSPPQPHDLDHGDH